MLPEGDPEPAERMAKAMAIHPLAARVLLQRGYVTESAINEFLQDSLGELPDPFRMKGMPGAVDRLVRALETQEPITLYGDYDVDGVCSTALLSLFLEELGAAVTTYIPHRVGEGYGLNFAAVERFAKDGTRVLVTLDCGITAFAEVTKARELGLDVVIVDHHTVPDTLPPATAILNPMQLGCGYPTRHLCAAGVAFNFCMGIRKRLRDAGYFTARPEPVLKRLLDLVALATVADVVPLTGANRILVKHGLHELTRAERPGVRALKEVAGLSETEEVTAGHVGFRLGPRINAAGRLHDASVGLRLLRCKTLEEARPLAQELESANAERQSVEQVILAQAMAQAETLKSSRGFVLYSDEWHPGVIGIVASRVVERYHRPTVMVGVRDGVGKGSGRSIEGFHLVEALALCEPHLTKFGGHKHAAGLTIESAKLPAFRAAFAQLALDRLTPEDLIRRCRVDAVVTLGDLTEGTVEGLKRLAPFGQGNPEPVFMVRRQVTRPRILPKKTGSGVGHMKLSLESAPSVDAMGFNMADRVALTEGPLDLAFNLGVDTFRGERRVSIKLKDLRASV